MNKLILAKTLRRGPDTNKSIKRIVQKDKRLVAYIDIEQEIIMLTNARKNQNIDEVYEYEHSLLDPAIERVAETHLTTLEYDQEFDRELIIRKYSITVGISR